MQPLNVEFSPESQIEFPFMPNKHLVGQLKITNKNDYPIVYKVTQNYIQSLKHQLLIDLSSDPIKVVSNLDNNLMFKSSFIKM